ncbi:ATP-dependent endonuclease [Ferruginibacter sp. HRS2-29]|uniref:ATP-dependent nuclease n=1 Tax=Ferruginibacter sp. HRS2-29 TaxID=2487334 RepID=UPI0020CD7C1C|nr:AAA family ATPase [Ferruginibacter sp. HRS2-29]MCP9750537.1 DUF2813 domain-containing protein [Ferruginibacter sp. HRS2-29]
MYLANLEIQNFRGINKLNIQFDKSLNIIIGENGSFKSAIIDAIRILYNFSNTKKDIYLENKDFHVDSRTHILQENIEIKYQFKDLSIEQQGAFYEFLIFGEKAEDTFAQVVLKFQYRENKNPLSSYYTGLIEGQKADYQNFELFQHYYLDALRDSTRDLLNAKNNILGKLVMRRVNKEGSKKKYEDIIETANKALLDQSAVKQAKDNVNTNLEAIYKTGTTNNKIGLRLDEPKAEPFINTIKPFLPFNIESLEGIGLELQQNSLGHNNLIYTATILGDAAHRTEDDSNTHFALLIEEPEAHLHPQLQLNLLNFLKENIKENTQVFITSHSPTLTSKAKLENLIVLNLIALRIDECFNDRLSESIVEDTVKKVFLKQVDFNNRKAQLERYLDVTKSQLLFACGALFFEGMTEELLLPAFFKLTGSDLQDHRIELVNVGGTSFYPFIHLFNSINPAKRINKKIAIITDGDQFPQSKDSKYSFLNLLKDDYLELNNLFTEITTAPINSRIPNLISAKNNNNNITIKNSFKTFEFEISFNNISSKKSKIEDNFFVQFVKGSESDKYNSIVEYYKDFDEDLTEEQHFKISILFWKTITGKVDFAQEFSLAILGNIDKAKDSFNIPIYIDLAFSHLVTPNCL